MYVCVCVYVIKSDNTKSFLISKIFTVLNTRKFRTVSPHILNEILKKKSNI